MSTIFLTRWLAAMAAALCLAGALQAQGLPPTIEADRQLQLAATEMDRKDDTNWQKVAVALKAAEDTGVRMPSNFDYHYGRALQATGRHGEALERLQRYLSTQGSKAKYYSEALALYSSAQAGAAANQAAAEQKVREDAAWRWVTSTWSRIGQNTVSCDSLERRVSRFASSMRNFDCACDVKDIDHPAYRDDLQTVCKARWQGNLLLDKVSTFDQDRTSSTGSNGKWASSYVSNQD